MIKRPNLKKTEGRMLLELNNRKPLGVLSFQFQYMTIEIIFIRSQTTSVIKYAKGIY